MKKIRDDEPIRVIIHMYMEMPRRNSLYSYLYLKVAKMSYFSFCLFSFFFYEIGGKEGKTGSAQWGGMALMGLGK
jgi:hypothetical protein